MNKMSYDEVKKIIYDQTKEKVRKQIRELRGVDPGDPEEAIRDIQNGNESASTNFFNNNPQYRWLLQLTQNVLRRKDPIRQYLDELLNKLKKSKK